MPAGSPFYAPLQSAHYPIDPTRTVYYLFTPIGWQELLPLVLNQVEKRLMGGFLTCWRGIEARLASVRLAIVPSGRRPHEEQPSMTHHESTSVISLDSSQQVLVSLAARVHLFKIYSAYNYIQNIKNCKAVLNHVMKQPTTTRV